MGSEPRKRRIVSGEVTLAIWEYGEQNAPTLVAVHGYPDSQAMWAPLARRIGSEMHVVTYDVRGAGESTAPARPEGYRTDRLVDDLVAVMDATSPGRPVHLLGHDWGSVQLWDAVTTEHSDARLHGRIATYTSVSGPPLDHVAGLARAASVRERLSRAARSWYVYAFHLPLLPELAWRHVGSRVLDAERARNGVNGLHLYRANIRRRMRHPREFRTSVPVQLIVATRDSYVRPAALRGLEDHVDHLHRVNVDAGHWLPRSHPDELAGLVTEWVLRGGQPSASTREWASPSMGEAVPAGVRWGRRCRRWSEPRRRSPRSWLRE